MGTMVLGVGVRGAAAFWLWNQRQASHWQTTSSMALVDAGPEETSTHEQL